MEERPDWIGMAMRTRENVTAAIGDMCSLLRTCNPLEIISRIAVYVITDTPTSPDLDTPQKNEAHLEYLISLAAALPFPIEAEFPSPNSVEKVIELLTRIHLTTSVHFSFDQHSKLEQRTPVEEMAAHLRIDKLHVRGDAYWPHLRETLVALLKPHDTKLKETLGFTSTDFFTLMERTESIVQSRIWTEIDVYAKPYFDLIGPWRNVMRPDAKPDEATLRHFENFVRENETALACAKSKFDAFGTPAVFQIFGESPEEQAILAALSCRFGENSRFQGVKPEHAFWPLNDSLTNEKPIIEHCSTYYAFHLPKILRGAYQLIGNLLEQADPGYWKNKFLKSRDKYLETETAALFGKAIPHSNIVTSASYGLPLEGKSAEVDIVVACDDVLIVVECKASALPDATRRGGVKSAETSLNRTIVGGLNQAERLVTEMVRCGTISLKPMNGGAEMVLLVTDFRWVFRVTVTLEMMSPVSTALWSLGDNQMVKTPERSWSVNLYDLRVIVEILNDPALFLHYLIRRLDLNVLKSVRAFDELDYLMHYIERGLFFREGNQPKTDEDFVLSGFTRELDKYYRRQQGLTTIGKKPKVPLGGRTKQMLDRLLKARPRRYLSACIELLELDLQVREDLLAKLPNQLSTLRQKSAAYAMSFVANLRVNRGLALSTSWNPDGAKELLSGRLVKHCQDNNLEDLLVILLGVPIGSAPIFIFSISASSNVDEQTARLLRNLRFEVTEHRKTSVDRG